MSVEVNQHHMNVYGLLWAILAIVAGNLLLALDASTQATGELVFALFMIGLLHVLFGLFVNGGQYLYSVYKGGSA